MNKQINAEAPVQTRQSIFINAAPEKVWQVLTNIDDWDKWQTDISRPVLNGALKPDTTFTWRTGGVRILSTLHTVQPYNFFGWNGKAFGSFAIHNWTLKEMNGQTQLSIKESMEGWLVSLLKKKFNENLQKGTQSWLDLLKKECEKI